MPQGILIWLPSALRPSPRLYEKMAADPQQAANVMHDTLQGLACGLTMRRGMLPWIKISTGRGAAFFDYQGIRCLQQHLCAQVTI